MADADPLIKIVDDVVKHRQADAAPPFATGGRRVFGEVFPASQLGETAARLAEEREDAEQDPGNLNNRFTAVRALSLAESYNRKKYQIGLRKAHLMRAAESDRGDMGGSLFRRLVLRKAPDTDEGAVEELF